MFGGLSVRGLVILTAVVAVSAVAGWRMAAGQAPAALPPAAEEPPGGYAGPPGFQPAEAVRGEGQKYRKLLRTIKVEGDQEQYGEFYDWGYWSGTEWQGHQELPPGYWVYVAPHWYIFGEAAGAPVAEQPDRRVAELERQVRQLRSEMEALRRKVERLRPQRLERVDR